MRTVLLGLVASLSLAAQDSRADYSLSGTVVNSVTGAPVKGAEVTLVALSNVEAGAGMPPNQPGPMIATSSSGAGGEYAFSGLPAGIYMLSAGKPGLVQNSVVPGYPEEIALSASVSGHTIRLAPLGVMEGTVSNQYGDPLAGVSVALYERAVEDGVRTVRPGCAATTNDRGQFRIWDLPPGSYYVQARRGAVDETLPVGYGSVRYIPWEGFRPVYFGGAHDPDSATPVTVAAGEVSRADFDITMEPTYKVRGKLESSGGGEPDTFEWLEADPSAAAGTTPINAVQDRKTGTFEIDGVPAGTYTLRVTQGQRGRGEATVVVKNGDVNGVSVALAPAVTVTGTVRLIGAGPGENRSLPDMALGGVANCHVSLVPSVRETGVLRHPAVPAQDGAFGIAGVLPGPHRLLVLCQNGYVVSAVSGGTDLLANPEIVVAPGVAAPPIEIAVRAGGGSLSGRLAVSGAAPGMGVLLVPAFKPTTGPVIQLASPIPGPTAELSFTFNRLAPGDYLAYAFSDIQSVEFRDPAFLNALTGGTSVHIEDGKTATVTLTGLVK
jgi:hypothetical protein